MSDPGSRTQADLFYDESLDSVLGHLGLPDEDEQEDSDEDEDREEEE